MAASAGSQFTATMLLVEMQVTRIIQKARGAASSADITAATLPAFLVNEAGATQAVAGSYSQMRAIFSYSGLPTAPSAAQQNQLAGLLTSLSAL